MSVNPQRAEKMKRFALDPAVTALVAIDMQVFACAALGLSDHAALERIVESTNRLARACRDSGIPVIWVRHNIRTEGAGNDGGLYPLFHDDQRTRLVMDLGPGTEIYDGMNVDSGRDHVVFKNRYSAFLSRPPELRLKLEALGMKQLLIAGIAANVCVESTLRDAMQLDYQVILVSDATAGTDDAGYRATIQNTQSFFGDVWSADEIIAEIGGKSR